MHTNYKHFLALDSCKLTRLIDLDICYIMSVNMNNQICLWSMASTPWSVECSFGFFFGLNEP